MFVRRVLCITVALASLCIHAGGKGEIPSDEEISKRLIARYKYTAEKGQIQPAAKEETLAKAKEKATDLTGKRFSLEMLEKVKEQAAQRYQVMAVGEKVSVSVGGRRVSGVVRSVNMRSVTIGDTSVSRRDFPPHYFDSVSIRLSRKRYVDEKYHNAKPKYEALAFKKFSSEMMAKSGYYEFNGEWYPYNGFNEHLPAMTKYYRHFFAEKKTVVETLKKAKSLENQKAVELLEDAAKGDFVSETHKVAISKALGHRKAVLKHEVAKKEKVGGGDCKKCAGKGTKRVQLPMTKAEAMDPFGGSNIRYKEVNCSACKGSGKAGGGKPSTKNPLKCKKCSGRGWQRLDLGLDDVGATRGRGRGKFKCSTCDGKGITYSDTPPCSQCMGTGGKSFTSTGVGTGGKCTRCDGTGRATPNGGL